MGLIVLAVFGIIVVLCLILFGAYHSIKCTRQLSSRVPSSQGSTPVKEEDIKGTVMHVLRCCSENLETHLNRKIS